MTPAPRLLEASWEVANKVGGIHTVVTSKLPYALADSGGRYLAIGPWLGQSEAVFTPAETPDWLPGLLGIEIHYGTWQVAGGTPCALLDWNKLVSESNAIKAGFWEKFSLDTLGSDFYDFDQPMLWGVAVARLADALATEPLILQAHEWLAGAAILAASNPNVKTVFTTHATTLGRSLASRNIPFYDQYTTINPDSTAEEIGVAAKHSLESLAARHANAFTTVSKLTADEATAFLGRQPDVITENGIDLESLPSFTELAHTHRHVHLRSGIFFDDWFTSSLAPSNSAPFWIYSMGRFETHNKGYDIYLESLGHLNETLKAADGRDVLALLFVAVPSRGFKPEAATARILRLSGQRTKLADLPAYDEVPVSPYFTASDDEILHLAANHGLKNRAEDKVRLIYVPAFLDGFDGLLNEPIYDLAAACDLGIFPSYYEPWGYTPMESMALGVPAITSDLAGFASAEGAGGAGLDVIRRRSGEGVDKLTELMQAALAESPRRRDERKVAAWQTIQNHFGWDKLYANYRTAYDLAGHAR
jgi:phosphorylase/glycogen(starch) synthase